MYHFNELRDEYISGFSVIVLSLVENIWFIPFHSLSFTILHPIQGPRATQVRGLLNESVVMKCREGEKKVHIMRIDYG